MNDYITFDSLKYRTNTKWHPEPFVPNTSRELLSGNLDLTFGNTSLIYWIGEIVAPVTAPGAGWGTITNLRASLKKRQAFTMTDHYGTSYSVHALGPFMERSLSPNWDSATNTIYVGVRLKGKAA